MNISRNEKEGIPADLLSLLDIIIEIPQQGVLRSLNVHVRQFSLNTLNGAINSTCQFQVTGGIVVWEYAKQHLFKQNL
jgi:tRNA guanosine-2'-O-methyltransferase